MRTYQVHSACSLYKKNKLSTTNEQDYLLNVHDIKKN